MTSNGGSEGVTAVAHPVYLPQRQRNPHPGRTNADRVAHRGREAAAAARTRNRKRRRTAAAAGEKRAGQKQQLAVSSSWVVRHGDRPRARRPRRRPPRPRRLRHHPVSRRAEDHGGGVLESAYGCDDAIAPGDGFMHVGRSCCPSEVPFGAPSL
uniref:Uncharacterized protein n=1 Tax=Oryza punctata TaxID=4537 RepID=A0A0E0MNP5_ORYPU